MPTQTTPTRMTIVNLARPGSPGSADNTLTAQFNPSELEETLSVNWNKQAVLGLSHMPLQYQQTDNHGFSFELVFHAADDTLVPLRPSHSGAVHNAAGSSLDAIARARLFLLACCYPSRGGATVATGAPPRLLFLWPQLATLTCVLRKVAIKHTLFNKKGAPVVFAAKLTIEEIRDVRLYSEDVFAGVTARSTWGA